MCQQRDGAIPDRQRAKNYHMNKSRMIDVNPKFIPFLLDDMLEGLLVYYIFKRRIKTEGLDKWCRTNGIDRRTMVRVIGDVYGFYRTMRTLGIKYDEGRGFLESMNLPFDKFMDYLRDIKMCIYQGFKINLGTFNKKDRKYYSPTGVLLDCYWPGFPKYITYYGGKYMGQGYSPNVTSVMSTFVGVDAKFY
jgi:hypothetical protein